MSDTLQTASGRAINHQNLREIGRGGEARVYQVDHETVFKLYNQEVTPHRRATSRTYEKLELMTARPPVTRDNQGNQVLAWPTELVYGEHIAGIRRRPIAGFLMPHVGGKSYRHIYNYWNPQARSQLKDVGHTPEDSWKLLEAIAANLIEMMKGVHDQGYLMGDANEQNILVAPTGLIAILDADSFQVRDPNTRKVYPCPVGRPEYTSASYLMKMKNRCPGIHCGHNREQPRSMSYACLPRVENDDRFSLAVMLFKLLMNGRHPYDGSPGQDYREKIMSRQPAVIHHPGALPPQALQRWSSLRPDWQEYLSETLQQARHRPESDIPEASGIFLSRTGLGNQRTVQPPAPTPQKAPPAGPSRRAAQNTTQVKNPAPRPPSSPARARTRSGSQPAKATAAAPVIHCRVCGHANTQAEIYCQSPGCQQELGFRKKDCPNCSRQIPHAAAYCRHCGAAAGHTV